MTEVTEVRAREREREREKWRRVRGASEGRSSSKNSEEVGGYYGVKGKTKKR